MAGFTESALEKKLDGLTNSQQSIQCLSLWLIHHRKHHNKIVKVWFEELRKGRLPCYNIPQQFVPNRNISKSLLQKVYL